MTHARKNRRGPVPWRRILCSVLLMFGLSGLPVVAQEVIQAQTASQRPPEGFQIGGELAADRISLANAVQMALAYNPDLERRRQDVAQALGALRSNRGSFDPQLALAPNYTYQFREISPILRRSERDKRDLLEGLRDTGANLVEGLNQAISDLSSFLNSKLPKCPDSLVFDSNLGVILILNDGRRVFLQAPLTGSLATANLLGAASADRAGTSVGNLSGGIFLQIPDLAGDVADLSQLCAADGRQSTSSFLNTLDDVFGLEAQGGTSVEQIFNSNLENFQFLRELNQTIRDKSALALERVGLLPEEEANHFFGLKMDLVKPMRNGIDLGLHVSVDNSERTYIGKSPDPAFGGASIPNSFANKVSVSLDVPLGKGRGRASRAANEMASESILEARRETLRHTFTETVFGSVVSYVNVAAQQAYLELIERSASRQRTILAATEDLLAAGETSVIEVDRSKARLALVERSVAATRERLTRSRVALAEALGLRVRNMAHAPATMDRLPQQIATVSDIEPLIESALARRRDLRAAERTLDASNILAAQARRDLQYQVDFSLNGGWSTLYESPFFKAFPIERRDPTTGFPVHFYSPRGALRSFDAKWKPFVSASITVTLPFGNNVAKGQLVQQRARVTSSEIDLADRRRIIEQNVIDSVNAVNHAAAEVELRRESAARLQEVYDASLDRYRVGEINLIDTLVTEEDLIREQIAVVTALQKYANFVTRLKFDTGEIVSFADEDTENEAAIFNAVDLWRLQ